MRDSNEPLRYGGIVMALCFTFYAPRDRSGEPARRTLLLSPFTFHILLGALLFNPAVAQVHSDSVGRDSRPLSDISSNLGAGSSPVHQSGGSVRDSSVGPLSGNPVRDSATGTVLSGPVSEASVGPVRAGRLRPMTGGPVGESFAGSVTGSIRPAPRQPIDLGALQEQLRAVQPLPRAAEPENEQMPGSEQPGAAPDGRDQAASLPAHAPPEEMPARPEAQDGEDGAPDRAAVEPHGTAEADQQVEALSPEESAREAPSVPEAEAQP